MTDNPHNNSTDTILRGIDRYNIQERIGTGGMARVYRAVDTALDRDVAVKVLHAYMADDDTFRARFEREAKFLASFHHPNVVQIYDFATVKQEDDYLCYMVMSYLPGQSLEAVMEKNSQNERLMPNEQMLRLAKDIANALQYAHEAGMVHRDVKPANILFDAEGRAILTDFGIARMVEHSKLTQENVAIGTPAYMAPEQVAGEAVDNRTDIYAFGIILYELITGHPPFGDNSVSVLLKHLNEPVPAATSFEHIDNQYLDDVLFKALAKKPGERYQTALELVDDLEKALTGDKPTNTQIIKQPTRPNDAVTSPLKDDTGVHNDTSRTNSPLGILAVGLSIILVIVVAAFIVNSMSVEPIVEEATAEVAVQSSVDSMVAEPEDNLAPSMTSPENMSFASDFGVDDPLVGLYWTLESAVDEERPGMITRQTEEDGTYVFSNSIPNRAATTIAKDFYYTEDITIVADIALDADSPANSGYGLVFHHTSPTSYGVFAVDGNGNYSIWFLQGTNWTELRNLPNNEAWTPHPAVNPMGEQNTLRLEIRGAMLTGYVNDEQVVQLENDALTEGEVGLYLAIPRTTQEAATITDYFEVIVANPDNTASSMTSDANSQ